MTMSAHRNGTKEYSETQPLSIKQRVNRIVEKRQKLRDEYKATNSKIQNWVKLRNTINEFANNQDWNKLIKADKNLDANWSTLVKETTAFSVRLNLLTNEKQTGNFDEAFARVERSWLNLGLVGPWRYGKSITISQLTGLDSYIVPLSQYAKCTGTTIDIINGKDINASNQLNSKYLLNPKEQDITSATDKANIYFYSLQEMCDLMNQYIGIAKKRFRFNPCSTPQAYREECLRIMALDEYKNPVSETVKERYVTFKEYIENAGDYAEYLTGKIGVIAKLDKDENKKIYRPFVSFLATPDNEYTSQSDSAPPSIYKVLAVKRAEVYTHFLLCGEEVGDIHIVDNPGYGEARIGVYDALEKSLKKDLDIAIALFKTTQGFEPSLAHEFHGLLLKAIHGRSPQDWLFYLFNLWGINRQNDASLITTARNSILKDLSTQFNTVNGEQIDGVKLAFDPGNLQRDGFSEHIAQLDCENEYETLQKFFYQILDVMSSSIVRVDETFFSKVKIQIKEVETLYNRVKKALDVVNNNLPSDKRKYVQKLLFRLYESLISLFPNDLNTDLVPITQPILKLCCGDKETDNRSVLLEILSHGGEIEFPSKTEKITYLQALLMKIILQSDFDAHIEFSKYEEQKRKIYEQFKNKFEQIIKNSNVDQSIIQLKSTIIQTFMNEGRLNFISKDKSEWLDLFIQKIRSGGKSYAALVKPFEEFAVRGISIEKSISDDIGSTIHEYLHINHFTETFFNDYKNICYQFVHSLYSIEWMLRNKLCENFQKKEKLDKFISPINSSFYGPNQHFLSLIFAIGIQARDSHPEYDALTDFYMDHFEQIADPDDKACQIMINSWRNNIKE